MMHAPFLIVQLALQALSLNAAEITTNQVVFSFPPGVSVPRWLTASRIRRVTAQAERVLEWDLRRIRVRWHDQQADFEKVHGFGPAVLAVTKAKEAMIHIGPKVSAGNFDGVFAHELAHMILYQKYRQAIPKWLEEGLANYVGKRGTVDYAWLASQPPRDLRSLHHPFGAAVEAAAPDPKYHYLASTAVMEMIASKCDVRDLLQLSVGQKLEGYLGTYCRIGDLNAEFQAWVRSKAKKRR